MRSDTIEEAGIDDEERLYVRPATTSFDYIYRAGLEVDWDSARKRLIGPKPREWSYVRWFEQIATAAIDEYGVLLTVTPNTLWSNVPDELRAAILQRRPSS